MKKNISRRHFLAGTAALASSNLLGMNAFAATHAPQESYRLTDAAKVAQKVPFYPPALLGLRGDNNGSQSHAHAVALGNQRYALTGKIEENYDLVVVGAGISGLAAAYRYVKGNPQARVLILDNHDDFGGHARRNEFTVNGKTLVTYGGSESLDSPKSFSETAQTFLRDLGVDYTKFERYFMRDLYPKTWQLTEGVFFKKSAFGQSAIVPEKPNTENAVQMIAQFPMDDIDKKALIDLYLSPKDYWTGKSQDERETLAASTSYYDFLKDTVKLGDASMKFLTNISSEYWGHAINAISVGDALSSGYPGVNNLKLKHEDEESEPYIYHFPDGNASIARLLVRKLIPAVASGNSMEDIVTAQFDYDMLDKPEHSTRLRLNSTVVRIENNAHGTALVYLRHGDTQMHQIQAKHTIFAGHSTIAAHIVTGMSDAQKIAMGSSVKVPMMYAKIAVKNARAWSKMGVHKVYVPFSKYCLIKLDAPVSMGDYRHSDNIDDPIVLHAAGIATDFNGKTAREMYRKGRRNLMKQDYAALEQELFEVMREMYASVGENFDDVVVGVTINRWAHGYAYEQVSLFDSDDVAEKTTQLMRQPVGKIHMANTDVAWMPYLQNAVEEGYRAAEEVLHSEQKSV